jgi:hypothetical protein
MLKGPALLDSLQNPISQSIFLNLGASFSLAVQKGLISSFRYSTLGHFLEPTELSNLLTALFSPSGVLKKMPTGSSSFQITIYFLLLLELLFQEEKGRQIRG